MKPISGRGLRLAIFASILALLVGFALWGQSPDVTVAQSQKDELKAPQDQRDPGPVSRAAPDIGGTFTPEAGAGTFPGTNAGAIPDGLPPLAAQTCNAAPRVINFAVAGITGPNVSRVTVDMTLTHSFVGDLSVTLAAPGGAPSLVIYRFVGATTATSFGLGSDLSGLYSFADAATGPNFWTAAAVNPVATGAYRTTASGGAGQTNPPPVTSLNTTFVGVTAAQANGTWTLTFLDCAQGDTGTVTAANLTILTPTAASGTVSGRITTPDGSPLGGAVIYLNGAASRTTVTDSSGNYHFDDLDTGNFYTVTPSLANYSFAPASRSFSLTGNRTDEGFTANPDASPSANAIDTVEYFVRQQYLDFLGREPDQGGLEYWSSQFTPCGSDATCIRNKRIDVSAAFFASMEFQQTGSYIYGLYAGTLGRTPGYGEFMPDRAQVVGGSGLDPAKAAFAQNFVQRAEFTNRYPQSMSREQFVDALIQTMQVRSGMFMTSYRDRFLNDYDTGGRALVVRHAAEAGDFVAAEYDRAFVLMEYFGYLRRDIDPGGYAFWLDVLNRGAGGSGMVCSFLTSTEYQHRFSTVVTHSNAECQ
jgi:subtilisin-like proprotein convertase family protein